MSRAREDEFSWTRLRKTRLVKTRPIGRILRDWHRRPTVFWRVYWQIELGFDHGVFDLQFYHHSVRDHLSAQQLAVDSSVFVRFLLVLDSCGKLIVSQIVPHDTCQTWRRLRISDKRVQSIDNPWKSKTRTESRNILERLGPKNYEMWPNNDLEQTHNMGTSFIQQLSGIVHRMGTRSMTCRNPETCVWVEDNSEPISAAPHLARDTAATTTRWHNYVEMCVQISSDVSRLKFKHLLDGLFEALQRCRQRYRWAKACRRSIGIDSVSTKADGDWQLQNPVNIMIRAIARIEEWVEQITSTLPHPDCNESCMTTKHIESNMMTQTLLKADFVLVTGHSQKSLKLAHNDYNNTWWPTWQSPA